MAIQLPEHVTIDEQHVRPRPAPVRFRHCQHQLGRLRKQLGAGRAPVHLQRRPLDRAASLENDEEALLSTIVRLRFDVGRFLLASLGPLALLLGNSGGKEQQQQQQRWPSITTRNEKKNELTTGKMSV